MYDRLFRLCFTVASRPHYAVVQVRHAFMSPILAHPVRSLILAATIIIALLSFGLNMANNSHHKPQGASIQSTATPTPASSDEADTLVVVTDVYVVEDFVCGSVSGMIATVNHGWLDDRAVKLLPIYNNTPYYNDGDSHPAVKAGYYELTIVSSRQSSSTQPDEYISTYKLLPNAEPLPCTVAPTPPPSVFK